MKRLALPLALVCCASLAVPAVAHNLYRKPKVGASGQVFKFRGTKWQPNHKVYWDYYARPSDEQSTQEGSVVTGARGRFRLRFQDFNLGRHRMCFSQIDTRYARGSGVAPGDGRMFRECKRYRVVPAG